VPEFAFVVETASGNTVEYRSRRCSATEAVERCQSKYPEGEVSRCIEGDVSDVELDSTTRGDTPMESSDTDPAPVTETPPVDPADLTVSELKEALADEDYDWNRAALLGLREAEKDAQERSTALDAIEERLVEEQQ